jgi:hypothetical protein
MNELQDLYYFKEFKDIVSLIPNNIKQQLSKEVVLQRKLKKTLRNGLIITNEKEKFYEQQSINQRLKIAIKMLEIENKKYRDLIEISKK